LLTLTQKEKNLVALEEHRKQLYIIANHIRSDYLLSILYSEVQPEGLDVPANSNQTDHSIPNVTAQEAYAYLGIAPSIVDDALIVATIQAHVSAKDKPFC
jgi:hypothetical protein